MRKVYANECARLRRHAQKYHNCSLFGTKFKMASQLSGIEIRQRDLDAKIKNPWLTKWEEEEVEISWLDTSSKKDEEKRVTRKVKVGTVIGVRREDRGGAAYCFLCCDCVVYAGSGKKVFKQHMTSKKHVNRARESAASHSIVSFAEKVSTYLGIWVITPQ